MLYLDTSLLVTALTNEPATARIHDWLAAQNAAELALSDWVSTEFASALAVKLRTGDIELAYRAEALAAFRTMCRENLQVLPVSSAHFVTATRFVDQHLLGIRAGDALHLAICIDHGATLCTLDRRLAEAAPIIGVKTILP